MQVIRETNYIELLRKSVAIINNPLGEFLLNIWANRGWHNEIANESTEASIECVWSDNTHFISLSAHYNIPICPWME